MSSSVVNLSRKPQCSVITHMRVPIFQKVTNSGEFTSTDWKSPSPFFEMFFFFLAGTNCQRIVCMLFFPNIGHVILLYGYVQTLPVEFSTGWKIFAQFTRNFRIRLNLFQLLSKALPSAYAQCATSANPSLSNLASMQPRLCRTNI